MSKYDDELRRLRSERAQCVCRSEYHRQLPSAPLLENTPPPRPPPPTYSDSVLEPKNRHRWVHRLAFVEFIFGACIVATTFGCVFITPYCPYASGIIAGSFVVLNSVIGIIASMRNSQNFFIAHLVLSVLVVLMLVACALMAWFLNLEPIGTDRHPSWGSNMCVLHRYDHNRLVAMNYQHTYEFARCIRDMKYGVAAHAINLVMAVVTCFLTFISAILCCFRTCICGDPKLHD